MKPQINIITLGVKDLEASRSFYEKGLGWKPSLASQGDVVFFQLGALVLALYPRESLAHDAQLPGDQFTTGFSGFTLAQNVATPEDVDRVLADAIRGGATLLKPAQDVFWGGRSGYFADVDGYAWEIAWNPHFALMENGSLKLP